MENNQKVVSQERLLEKPREYPVWIPPNTLGIPSGPLTTTLKGQIARVVANEVSGYLDSD